MTEPAAVPRVEGEEFFDLYLRDGAPLGIAFNPCPAEVNGLVEIEARDFARLTADPRYSAAGMRLSAADHATDPVCIRWEDFVPSRDYYARVAEGALALTEGRPITPW